MELYDPAALRALLQKHGFHFSKGLGQNFLCDPEALYTIAESAAPDAA